MKPTPSIAILLFTRTPEEEALHKTWVADGGVKLHARLAGAFIRNARRVARRSGLPLHVIRSDQQVGRTFGERLANAFSDVFGWGYSGVIAIGNDALGLSADDLKNAAEGLHRHDAVLGATHDGGAYLIGLSRRAFQPDLFSRLPWETGNLFDALSTHLQGLDCTFSQVETKIDVDTPADFSTVCRMQFGHSALMRAIQCLLASGDRWPEVLSKYIPHSSLHARPTLRAPPFSHHLI